MNTPDLLDIANSVPVSELKAEYVGEAADLFYQGSHDAPVLREGIIEGIGSNHITLNMGDGQYRAFSLDKIHLGMVFIYNAEPQPKPKKGLAGADAEQPTEIWP